MPFHNYRIPRGVPNHLLGQNYDEISSDNSCDDRQMRLSTATTSTTGVTTTTTTSSGSSSKHQQQQQQQPQMHPQYVRQLEERIAGYGYGGASVEEQSSSIVDETSRSAASAATHNKSKCDSNVCDDEADDDDDDEEDEEDDEGDDEDADEGEEAVERERPMHLRNLKLIEQNIMLPSELELKYKNVRRQNDADMDAIFIEAISPPPGAPPKSENPARLRRYHRLN